MATVFVPGKAARLLFEDNAAYRDEDRPLNQRGETGPKNETLVASIDTVRLAVARSIYTDKADLFPNPGATTWWEAWLHLGTRATFDAAAQRLDLMVRNHTLTFPDREVVLVCATPEVLGHIVANTDTIAELRLARDTPGLFMAMDGAEQRLWSDGSGGADRAAGRRCSGEFVYSDSGTNLSPSPDPVRPRSGRSGKLHDRSLAG